jgi:hypothetical protein
MSEITCVICKCVSSPTWWKCCSKHTTEQGLDVVCQTCAGECLQNKKEITVPMPVQKDEFTSSIYTTSRMCDPRVVERLRNGDWSFGCDGLHHGSGSLDCPIELHHHHDEFCHRPTSQELEAAGIKREDFKIRSRR